MTFKHMSASLIVKFSTHKISQLKTIGEIFVCLFARIPVNTP